MYCQNCGKEVDNKVKICSNCGSNLRDTNDVETADSPTNSPKTSEWNFDKLFVFTPNGRMCRRDYCIFYLVWTSITFLLIAIMEFEPVFLLPAIMISIMFIFACIKRLHDSNVSGWWVILLIALDFIPPEILVGNIPISIPGLLASVGLMAIKGDVGKNKYGKDPLTE